MKIKITIDLYQVGYNLGYYGSAILQYTTVAGLASTGLKKVAKIAATHKIDASKPSVVTDNVFNCLKFID